MNMCINATSGDDLALSSNDIRAAAYHHAWRHALHDVRVTRLTNAHDQPVLYANVSLVNSCPVHDQSVGDNQIQRSRVRPSGSLSHALAERLAPAKLAFVTVYCEVLFNLYPQIRHTKPHDIARRWPKHGGIRCPAHLEALNAER